MFRTRRQEKTLTLTKPGVVNDVETMKARARASQAIQLRIHRSSQEKP